MRKGFGKRYITPKFSNIYVPQPRRPIPAEKVYKENFDLPDP